MIKSNLIKASHYSSPRKKGVRGSGGLGSWGWGLGAGGWGLGAGDRGDRGVGGSGELHGFKGERWGDQWSLTEY